MKILSFIDIVLLICETAIACKAKKDGDYLKALWYLGWAIIMYLAALSLCVR